MARDDFTPLRAVLSGRWSLSRALELLSAVSVELAGLHQAAKTHGALSVDAIRVSTGGEAMAARLSGAKPGGSEADDLKAMSALAFEVLLARPPRAGERLESVMPALPADFRTLLDRLEGDGEPITADELWGEISALRAQLPDAREEEDDEAPTSIGLPGGPLEARPQLKKPVPALVVPGSSELTGKVKQKVVQKLLGTLDDEPTVAVPSVAAVGPPDEDESTAAMTVVPKLGDGDERTAAMPALGAERDRPTLAAPKPILTPESVFVPDDADVPSAALPKLPPPSKRAQQASSGTPMEQLLRLARRQPTWVWGALGGGLAFLAVLLMLITR